MTNCSASLLFSVELLGPMSEDGVIVTPETFRATVRPLPKTRLNVRFAHVNANALTIDPSTRQGQVTARTKAIDLVHLRRLMAEIAPMVEIARCHNLCIGDRCARASGSQPKGHKADSIGGTERHSLEMVSTMSQGGVITLTHSGCVDLAARLRSSQSAQLSVRARWPAADVSGPSLGASATHRCRARQSPIVRTRGLQ